MKRIVNLICLSLITISFFAQQKIDISKNSWNLWLDENAQWSNDKLFIHSTGTDNIDINAPTCGWNNLMESGIKVTLPSTVEEHFWNKTENPFGVSGDYLGVSWFTTTLNIPQEKSGKHIFLEFESVRLRAEVYVNQQLAGCDIIFGTNFKFDITKFVKYGQQNDIAVRITDPDGNFTWTDFNYHTWGKNLLPPSHGFGGITGKVYLSYADNIFFDDIYIKNKPTANSIRAELTLTNLNQKPVTGNITYELFGDSTFSKPLFNTNQTVSLDTASTLITQNIQLPNAELWSPESPTLYYLRTTWKSKDGTTASSVKRFGFRWFEVKNVNGERYFALNGKRIVLRTSISWGYWPVNGIYPTPEMADKQIRLAKDLGLNMLNFHRGIGQTIILDKADELGLLYLEEPGGYKTGGNFDDDFLKEYNRTRLFRMIKRDRSHPSLIIYNMINEISNRQPMTHEIEDLKEAHKIDNTRIITYTSTNFFKPLHGGTNPTTPTPVKSHMLPYDDSVHIQGWWDQHFPDGPGVYCDKFYKSPTDIFRNSTNKAEIVMWGEEGAIGTPPRLELIANQIKKTGEIGWDGDSYLSMYKAYSNFLNDNKPFKKAFPTVDDFTKSFGNVAMYYQGRVIENVRIGNVVDCYVVNGWESEKIENHSGVVDVYRNPKGDPSIMSYYNQPLYVSVKLRTKVLELGDTAIADFFVVNEKNINGKCELRISMQDNVGVYNQKKIAVTAKGGNIYGELLKQNMAFVPRNEGHTTILAELWKNNKLITKGQDKIYAVNLKNNTAIPTVALYDDTLGTVAHCLKVSKIPFIKKTTKSLIPIDEKVLFMGAYDKSIANPGIEIRNELLEWVKRGNTLVILQDADLFAEFLSLKEVLDYRGKCEMRGVWYGGNYAVAENPYFEGLPLNSVFNWEYQALAQYHKNRWALRLGSGECLVTAIADHKAEVFSALQKIKIGKGQILLSTLDIPIALNRKNEPANVVAKKILRNMAINL